MSFADDQINEDEEGKLKAQVEDDSYFNNIFESKAFKDEYKEILMPTEE